MLFCRPPLSPPCSVLPPPPSSTHVTVPQDTIHGRQSQPPHTPPYVMPAESLILFHEQDCLANGAHLYKQPQCHQWTLVTVGQSPRFGRPAARDLVPRQNLSPSLKRAAWVGRGGVLGSPESDLPVLKEGRKESGGEPEKVVLTEATPSSSGLRPGPSSSRKLHWRPSSLLGTPALTLII